MPQPIQRFGYLAIKNILTATLNEGDAPSCMLLSVGGHPSAAVEGRCLKVTVNCPRQPTVD